MVSDEVLIVAYVQIDVPADQLVLDGSKGDRFVDAVRQKAIEPVDREQALARLLTLRKTGRLPRLRRSRR